MCMFIYLFVHTITKEAMETGGQNFEKRTKLTDFEHPHLCEKMCANRALQFFCNHK